MNTTSMNSITNFPAAQTSAAVAIETIEVIECGVYRGPHMHGRTPMVRLQVCLGTFEEIPTNHLAAFNENLIAQLPGLSQHQCCFHEAGGFLLRLTEGTWLGHVIEHVAIELQKSAGANVSRGKTRSVKGKTGFYNVMYEYEEESLALLCGALAIRLVDSFVPPALRGARGIERISDWFEDDFLCKAAPALTGQVDLPKWIAILRAIHMEKALGPTTASLIEEARDRGIPVLRLDDSSLVQLGYGKQQRRVWAAMTSSTSQIGVDIAADKELTKNLLKSIGLPVPRGVVVHTFEEALPVLQRIPLPLVAKPLCGNHGRGVTLNISSADELARGVAVASAISHSVVVEEQYAGNDYRILVVSGRVIAVAERVPAHVTGDGVKTIAALVEAENKNPRRGDGHENVMTKIVVDESVIQTLRSAGLELDSVPDAGVRVFLRLTGNISTGGTAIDRTDEIHPANAEIAERAAAAIGLDVAGIDFLAPDISRPVWETGGGIVEVNAAPGLRMHMFPSEGQPRHVAGAIIDTVFPDMGDGRIPIFAITGTNGKSTTTLMLAHILHKAGKRVGMATTSGIFVNGARVAKADASGPKSARFILRDPTIDVAVLETARGGIVREGLAFDQCDVGAVLNVDADHLGLDSVTTVEDLAWVKSLVVEAVRRGGVSVLNADDQHCLKMEQRAGGRPAYFSMHGDKMSDFLQEHIALGGLAIVRTRRWGDEIVLYDRGRKERVIAVKDIPAALGGIAEFNIANAMAAAIMAYGQGIELHTITAGLNSFSNCYESNPGRLNITDEPGFRVIVDYGHNPASLRAIGRLVENMSEGFGQRIGMISAPGDRRDEDLKEMGRIAAGFFDRLVFRETPDQRGRAAGVINGLMAEGALAAGFPSASITKIIEEFEAVDFCLKAAEPGDLVVLMATRFDEVWKLIKEFEPNNRHLFKQESSAECTLQISTGH